MATQELETHTRNHLKEAGVFALSQCLYFLINNFREMTLICFGNSDGKMVTAYQNAFRVLKSYRKMSLHSSTTINSTTLHLEGVASPFLKGFCNIISAVLIY